jgi:hypothetical protein
MAMWCGVLNPNLDAKGRDSLNALTDDDDVPLLAGVHPDKRARKRASQGIL